MYTPTAKGYFSGCGGMELGLLQAGVNLIQLMKAGQRLWTEEELN